MIRAESRLRALPNRVLVGMFVPERDEVISLSIEAII